MTPRVALAVFDSGGRLVSHNGGFDCDGEFLPREPDPGITPEAFVTHLARCAAAPPEPAGEALRGALLALAQGDGADLTLRLRDGSYLQLTRQPLPHGGRLLLGVDAGELRELACSRRDTEQRFRHFTEIAADWFWEMGPDLRFSYLSGRHAEKTGWASAGVLGKTRRELYGDRMDDPQKWARHFAALEAHEPYEIEFDVTRDDGSTLTVHNIGEPIIDADGTFQGYRGIGRDITERKRTQREIAEYRTRLERMVSKRTAELETANRELASFGYSVSHDLRSPLRSIDGFSQVLLDEYAPQLDERARDYLARVRNAAQRMGQLIDDVLRLTRLSLQELRAEGVDLSALALDVVAQLRDAERAREVRVEIQPGLAVIGDRRLIRILLQNLLGNAWKYTRHCARPRVSLTRSNHRGEETFVVSDNGVGFDMRYVDKLFRPFQRLHGVDEFEGSGIGLATVAQIVERHGGRAWARAEPGRGARFYFTLG